MAKRLVLTCGLPGCGKSTFLSSGDPMWRIYGQNDIDRVILSPDQFRLVLTGKAYYGPAEDSVWSHVKTVARVLLTFHQKVVIIDATHLTEGSRSQWTRMAKELGVDIDCIWFNVPNELAMERNRNRERVVPEDVVERMINSFESPTYHEGFSQIYTMWDQSQGLPFAVPELVRTP